MLHGRRLALRSSCRLLLLLLLLLRGRRPLLHHLLLLLLLLLLLCCKACSKRSLLLLGLLGLRLRLLRRLRLLLGLGQLRLLRQRLPGGGRVGGRGGAQGLVQVIEGLVDVRGLLRHNLLQLWQGDEGRQRLQGVHACSCCRTAGFEVSACLQGSVRHRSTLPAKMGVQASGSAMRLSTATHPAAAALV